MSFAVNSCLNRNFLHLYLQFYYISVALVQGTWYGVRDTHNFWGAHVAQPATKFGTKVVNNPFAHGGLFWPGCQIRNVSVGSVWYYAKCFNNIVAKSVCYRTVKPWWIYFKMGLFYNYFSKPTLCENATETDSSADEQRSLDGRVVIEITHGTVACNRLSVERCLANGPLAFWFQLPRRLPPYVDILLDAHDKTDKECDACLMCKTRPSCSVSSDWSASRGV